MARDESIQLGVHFEQFIKNKVESGSFASASEVIVAALQLLEEAEETKIKLLNFELEKGEQSAIVHDFNSKEHLKDLHKKFL